MRMLRQLKFLIPGSTYRSARDNYRLKHYPVCWSWEEQRTWIRLEAMFYLSAEAVAFFPESYVAIGSLGILGLLKFGMDWLHETENKELVKDAEIKSLEKIFE